VDKMTFGEVVFRLVELSAATIAPVMFHTHLHPQSSASQKKSNPAKPAVLPTKPGNRVQSKYRSVSLLFIRHPKINSK